MPSKRKHFIYFLSCILFGISLISNPTYALADDLQKSQSSSLNAALDHIEDSCLNEENRLGFQNIPNVPQEPPFSEEGEILEESTEKDADEDDLDNHYILQSHSVNDLIAPLLPLPKSILIGLNGIPLYLLFHRWKSFLS